MPVGVVHHPVLRKLLRLLLEPGTDHHPQPDPQLVFVGHRLHEIDRLEGRARVLKTGDALRQRFLRRKFEDPPVALTALLVGRRRLAGAPLDQARGGLAKEPRRIAFRILEDLAPFGVLRRARDARELHRQRVDETGMAARVRQHHGICRRHMAERGFGWKSLHARRRWRLPLLLMPAATVDPLAWLRGLSGGLDHCQNVVPRLRRREFEHELRLADAGEVPVSFDEPRDDELPSRVDDLGSSAHVALDLVLVANRNDPIAGDGDGTRVGQTRLHRHDFSVHHDERRRLNRRRLLAACRDEGQRCNQTATGRSL